MTGYLMALEVGPVVEMIRASRKTRDLWFGSWLMSEVAKSVALAVAKEIHPRTGYAKLIFPAPDAMDQLAPGSDFTVADEIWVEIPPECKASPKTLAKAAKQAAHDRWRALANEVIDDRRCKNLVDMDVWTSQTPASVDADFAGEVVECYAAWVARTGDYTKDRDQARRLLAGRTACRNFPQQAFDDSGRPKCSLDGARPTVLRERSTDEDSRRRLRLTAGEQLDAPGLVKRHGGESGRYPSVSRIAADPWLRGASRRAAAEFAAFKEACDELARQKAIVKLDLSRFPKYADFPYEGSVVYKNRHPELAEELAGPRDVSPEAWRMAARATLTETLGTMREKHRALETCLGEPSPYSAVLVADGDDLGDAIAERPTPDDHRRFSTQLRRFAEAARRIIQEHRGADVYVGGEDILAFLPVDTVVPCARALHETLGAMLAEYAPPGKSITLSAGIAIAHANEALEDVLAWGHAAEQRAKRVPGKNALALSYRPRGGAPIELRWKWDENPDVVLRSWAELLSSGAVPDKVPFDLRRLADDYVGEIWNDPSELANATRRDAARLMSRKSESARSKLRDHLARIDGPKDLTRLAETILVARWLARALEQAGEESDASAHPEGVAP